MTLSRNPQLILLRLHEPVEQKNKYSVTVSPDSMTKQYSAKCST